MSMKTLAARLARLSTTVEASPRTWAFVLLGDQELSAEQWAMIGPHDNVYIKRIILEPSR